MNAKRPTEREAKRRQHIQDSAARRDIPIRAPADSLDSLENVRLDVNFLFEHLSFVIRELQSQGLLSDAFDVPLPSTDGSFFDGEDQ